MQMDEILASVADHIKNFAVTFLVDISAVPDFNTMYELYDPCTIMFFFRWVFGPALLRLGCVWGVGGGRCTAAVGVLLIKALSLYVTVKTVHSSSSGCGSNTSRV
jgi:hypothetical protein